MTFGMFRTIIHLYVLKYYSGDVSELENQMAIDINNLVQNIDTIVTRNRKPFAVTNENFEWSLPLIETLNALMTVNAEKIIPSIAYIRRLIFAPLTILDKEEPIGYDMNVPEILIGPIIRNEVKLNKMRQLMMEELGKN